MPTDAEFHQWRDENKKMAATSFFFYLLIIVAVVLAIAAIIVAVQASNSDSPPVDVITPIPQGVVVAGNGAGGYTGVYGDSEPRGPGNFPPINHVEADFRDAHVIVGTDDCCDQMCVDNVVVNGWFDGTFGELIMTGTITFSCDCKGDDFCSTFCYELPCEIKDLCLEVPCDRHFVGSRAPACTPSESALLQCGAVVVLGDEVQVWGKQVKNTKSYFEVTIPLEPKKKHC